MITLTRFMYSVTLNVDLAKKRLHARPVDNDLHSKKEI